MNELSLFTGAGGGIWGTKLLGWRTIGYVEVNPYCQKIIQARIGEGYFDDAPIFGDIRTFIHRRCGLAHLYLGMVDVLTAGFPCQPFSTAGKRLGEADGRNLWPQTIRCIRIVRPRYVFLENVATLTSNPYFGVILGDLAQAGYDAEWCVLGADDVGDPPAPHERKRVWILAYADKDTRRKEPRSEQEVRSELIDGLRSDGETNVAHTNGGRQLQPEGVVSHERRWVGDGSEEMANAQRDGCDEGPEVFRGRQSVVAASREDLAYPRWWDTDPAELPDADEERCDGWTGLQETTGETRGAFTEGDYARPWPVESRLGRMAYGVADRRDRVTAIGEGQVPAVVAAAWRLLSGAISK